MKKYFNMLCIIFIALFNVSGNALAAELPVAQEDCLETSEDLQEIQLLEEEILSGISETGASQLPEGIDFSKAVRVYTDTDIVALNTKDQEKIMNALEDSAYVWVIPVEAAGETYSVTVAKGLPLSADAMEVLTEAQQEEVRSKEGKWQITEIVQGGVEGYIDQLAEYEEELQEYSRIVFLGSQPGMRMPVAIGFRDGEAAAWISLGYEYPVMEEGEKAREITTGIYDFEQISSMAQKYETGGLTDDSVSGLGSSGESHVVIWSCLVVGAVCIAGVSVFLVRRKRKG